MRAAIAKVYPQAQPQLCIFHINQNVVLQLKKKWKKEAAAEVAATQATQATRQRRQDAPDEEILRVVAHNRAVSAA